MPLLLLCLSKTRADLSVAGLLLAQSHDGDVPVGLVRRAGRQAGREQGDSKGRRVRRKCKDSARELLSSGIVQGRPSRIFPQKELCYRAGSECYSTWLPPCSTSFMLLVLYPEIAGSRDPKDIFYLRAAADPWI